MREGPAALLVVILAALPGCAGDTDRAHREFATIRDAYLVRYEPLYRGSSNAWWEANITGTDEAFARKAEVDKALVDLHSDRTTFEKLERLRDEQLVRDPVAARELNQMVRSFLAAQADPAVLKRIVDLENEVEQKFNTFRSRVGERTLTENDVRAILAKSTDPAEVEAAWKAYMEVGVATGGTLRALAHLRNEVARSLGFRDWFEMSLHLQEIDEDELLALFDELDRLTREPFAELKARMDTARAARFGIAVTELRPWHYGDLFFQEAPTVSESGDVDAVLAGTNATALAARYYDGIGLPVDDILARSDLYERPGKCPHAYCADMDRAGDVRVLANLRPNVYGVGTLMHELGHGVYSKFVGDGVPFLLRDAPHGLTTEGIAEMFSALVLNEEWLRDVAGVPAEQAAEVGRAARTNLRTERLMFARWTQVMLHFERGLYGDPDADLSGSWWELKKRYQLLEPPDRTDRPDHAAKIHVLTSPVYYHSYMMGELFAAQLRHALVTGTLGMEEERAITTSFHDRPEVGTFLREKVFGPGDTADWRELTRRATGEPLGARSFAEELAALAR